MMKLLVVGLGVSLLGSGWIVLLARLARVHSHDPRSVLRRCKARLKLVRRDLDLIPATREIYNLYGEIENTELTIKRTESLFHHATGK
jgi:hypothetical protein